MTKNETLLIRLAVEAEIEYRLAKMEPGADGYYGPALRERHKAELAWQDLLDAASPDPA